MRYWQSINYNNYNQLSVISFTSLLFWLVFSIICFGTNPSDNAAGSIVAKFEFIIQISTLLVLGNLFQKNKNKLDKQNYIIFKYFIAANLWLFFVDLFFYIAAYVNDSLLQELSFVYFLLYYAPCIVFAMSMVALLSKILIKNILLANGFARRITILLIVDFVIFSFFLSSIHYAYTIFSFKNVLQIILLLTEFILFNIAIIGLIYAKNISAFLFLSGIIILVTGDFFLTYTYIAQTTTLFFMGELLWFLGLIFLMLTSISIKNNKHFLFNQWFRSDNAIRSRLGFDVFLTSISGFLIAFIISYLCRLIDKQVFIIFPPFIMLYSTVVVALSAFIAKSFESPFKKMENNINCLMINNDKNKIDNNFAMDEFVTLQDYLTKAFDAREEKDQVKRIFGETAAKTAHDVASPIAIMSLVLHELKNSAVDKHQIDLLERSMINIKNIMGKLLKSYRNLDLKLEQKYQNILIQDDLSEPRYILFSKLIEEIIENKIIEWNNSPCILSLNIEESCKNAWAHLSPLEFTRTLSNLLNNAYESLKNQNRRIYIFLTIHYELENINAPNFLLIIEDTGIGIAPEHIEGVKNGVSLKHIGKGLGLVNSIKYFQSLDGRLILESKLNQGTKINISFPMLEKPELLTETITYRQNCTLVVLDDDDAIRTLLFRILNTHRIDFKIFKNIKELDGWYNNNFKIKPIIFLCDYDLGEAQYNGIDIINKYNLKEHAYLMTSYSETAWMQKTVFENSIRLISKTLIDKLQLVCIN